MADECEELRSSRGNKGHSGPGSHRSGRSDSEAGSGRTASPGPGSYHTASPGPGSYRTASPGPGSYRTASSGTGSHSTRSSEAGSYRTASPRPIYHYQSDEEPVFPIHKIIGHSVKSVASAHSSSSRNSEGRQDRPGPGSQRQKKEVSEEAQCTGSEGASTSNRKPAHVNAFGPIDGGQSRCRKTAVSERSASSQGSKQNSQHPPGSQLQNKEVTEEAQCAGSEGASGSNGPPDRGQSKSRKTAAERPAGLKGVSGGSSRGGRVSSGQESNESCAGDGNNNPLVGVRPLRPRQMRYNLGSTIDLPPIPPPPPVYLQPIPDDPKCNPEYKSMRTALLRLL